MSSQRWRYLYLHFDFPSFPCHLQLFSNICAIARQMVCNHQLWFHASLFIRNSNLAVAIFMCCILRLGEWFVIDMFLFDGCFTSVFQMECMAHLMARCKMQSHMKVQFINGGNHLWTSTLILQHVGRLYGIPSKQISLATKQRLHHGEQTMSPTNFPT